MPRQASLAARALISFLALPGVVAFVVPWLLLRPLGDRPLIPAGLVPFALGALLLLWCVRDFYVSGRGTLAPWDPPRALVVSGPYRYSRNPMYLAVTLVLAGWAITFGSGAFLLYALAVLLAFHLRVVLGEEPWLTRTHGEAFRRYRARVPRWIFPNRRAVWLSLAAVIVCLPLAGLVYEAYADARTAREFPPPGQLIDIGGRRLHLVCIGRGEPTVMFEAPGFGVSSLSAEMVRERVAARTQVCSYDRAGMGWSDAGPSPMTAGMLVNDLAVLQDRAKLRAPFVMVASSVGGLVVELLARRYPERVAGLVFLDAASSEGLRDISSRYSPRLLMAVPLITGAAQLGVMRLLDPLRIPLDAETGRRSAAITYSGRSFSALGAIARGAPETLREFEAAPPLPGDVPLVVLSAETQENLIRVPGLEHALDSLRDDRLKAHQRLAKLSTRGSWRIVPKSDHLIATSQPDAVVDAIFSILDSMQ